MWWSLHRIVVQSMLISGIIFCALLLGERVFPALYRTPVTWDLLIVLFGVQFVPRVIGLLLDRLPKKTRKRRKT